MIHTLLLILPVILSLASTTAFRTSGYLPRWSSNLFIHSSNRVAPVIPLRCTGNDQNDKDIIESIDTLGISTKNKESILSHLERSGLWEPTQQTGSSFSNTIGFLAEDFVDRPEAFSTILIKDFDFPSLTAHQTRAVVMNVVKKRIGLQRQQIRVPQNEGQAVGKYDRDATSTSAVEKAKEAALEPWTIVRNQHHVLDVKDDQNKYESTTTSDPAKEEHVCRTKEATVASNAHNSGARTSPSENAEEKKPKTTRFKATVVNEKAKTRRNSGEFEYALNDDLYPALASDLQAFFAFMTRPSPHSQEDPIRAATAEVYMRHARQFLGWYVNQGKPSASSNGEKEGSESDESFGLQNIIPNKDKESANDIIDFVLWLRSRDISVSYEANVLRGLTKLLKFRFARESESDSSNGGNTFADIPLIKEIRKLHRDANKRQKLAPRSSDEQKKWLSWPEYLQVIKELKQELLDLMEDYFKPESTCRKAKVAEAYQCYLILSLFASIPDRQRTMRELAIGSTLVKSEESDRWTVRHGPDDYKTGKSYGERPAIQLREDLSRAIDDYIENWRSALEPSTDFLFVQSRTGKPLTGDGIFQRVSRSCFKYGGKRTNPHLLRDMIVTHVRASDASEKELEALALYMGHSLNMQRTSYDRRTLTTKIAPAVELMQSINTDS